MNLYLGKAIRKGWLIIAAAFTSCVYQEEVPCPCDVRFVYDYNMEFADAFPKQVDDVTLFVFDSEGRFVSVHREQGDCLDADYRMPLDLPAGQYHLVAWAGTAADKDCYRLTTSDLKPGTSTLHDLQLALNCTGTSHSKRLADLWHGEVAEFNVCPYAPSTVTVPLVKNTNRLKVMLQTVAGQPLLCEDYTFAIIDANYSFNYDNTLRDVPLLSYYPYQQKAVNIENDASRNPTVGTSALVAEMNTLRLMADRSPRFVVRDNRSRQTLFDINLRQYLDLMRLSDYADMPLQEFLDRENTWHVILVMGQGSDGVPTILSLQINAWKIVLNDNEL